MDDCSTEPLRPQFDRRLRLRFFGAKVTSDAGLLAYRELGDALDLTRTAAGVLRDHRTGRNPQHTATALLRQSIYSRRAGYEDRNDAERLRFDPALRTVVGGRAREFTIASTSEMARLETETLTTKQNREIGVEPRRVGMVRREVGGLAKGRAEGGRRGARTGIRLCRSPRSHRFSLDMGMRRVSNACSGEPGEVPDEEVNAQLGNPGWDKDITPCLKQPPPGLGGVLQRPKFEKTSRHLL
jgi:hypothetical protein